LVFDFSRCGVDRRHFDRTARFVGYLAAIFPDRRDPGFAQCPENMNRTDFVGHHGLNTVTFIAPKRKRKHEARCARGRNHRLGASKGRQPAVPITVAEQVESTQAAFEAGASLVHIHVCETQTRRLLLTRSYSRLSWKACGVIAPA
jgi:beta-keto acid cleavage enzyme